MQDFSLWLETGMTHILDINGYDHICYVVALAIMYSFRTWKPLLFLITAFTLGHSLSLGASTLNIVKVPQNIIEIIIPLTIIVTCILNLRNHFNQEAFAQKANYGLALFFGLIHGLGFSYLLKSMLGKSENILAPLFSFNLGLEIGQLIIVFIVLILTFFVKKSNTLRVDFWQKGISVLVLLVALKLFVERF
jgi:hypothetical protein